MSNFISCSIKLRVLQVHLNMISQVIGESHTVDRDSSEYLHINILERVTIF